MRKGAFKDRSKRERVLEEVSGKITVFMEEGKL